MGRGGAAYGSSNSLRSQDRASDGGMGGPPSTSGFSGFEDATEGELQTGSKCVVPNVCCLTLVWQQQQPEGSEQGF